MSNMNNMMKQAQALQRKLMETQGQLAEEEVRGSAGGGAVTVTATGAGEIRAVEIAAEVVDPDDVEADLDTILKDRIASGDDDQDDEDEEEVAPEPGAELELGDDLAAARDAARVQGDDP